MVHESKKPLPTQNVPSDSLSQPPTAVTVDGFLSPQPLQGPTIQTHARVLCMWTRGMHTVVRLTGAQLGRASAPTSQYQAGPFAARHFFYL